jgi:cytochrome c oxidase subunit 3
MADAHAKNHDYHLVDPARGPLSAPSRPSSWRSAPSCGCTNGASVDLVMLIGLAACSTPCSWWRDVIIEAHKGDHTPVVAMHHRYGMILFIASEVMFFVAWFWAYFDASLFNRRSHPSRPRSVATGGVWPPKGVEPPVRSVAPAAVQHADPADLGHHRHLGAPRAAQQRSQGPEVGPALTVVLGALFTVRAGLSSISATPASSSRGNIYGATFFMATGFHGFHVSSARSS